MSNLQRPQSLLYISGRGPIPVLARHPDLGRGSFGSGLRYDALFDKRSWAVKFPLNQATPSHLHELRTACAAARGRIVDLVLPNIATYRGEGIIDDQPVECHDFMEGENLGNFMVKNLLSNTEKIGVSLDLIEALQALQKEDLMYRDLKPGNIIIRRLSDGSLKVTLIDMGTLIGTSSYNTKGLLNPEPVGSLRIAPPEAFDWNESNFIEGKNEVYDAYSLGITMAMMFESIIWLPVSSSEVINFCDLFAQHGKNSAQIKSILNRTMSHGGEFHISPSADTPPQVQTVIKGLTKLAWQDRMTLEEAWCRLSSCG